MFSFSSMKVLLVYPEFPDTFWSFKHALPFPGKQSAYPPLGLLTVAAMLPATWQKRVVDLNASDGTKLKATYFPSAKPGPGVLLLHQCDQDRKIWDPLPQQLAATSDLDALLHPTVGLVLGHEKSFVVRWGDGDARDPIRLGGSADRL